MKILAHSRKEKHVNGKLNFVLNMFTVIPLKARNDVNWCCCSAFTVNLERNHCKTQDSNRVVYLGV